MISINLLLIIILSLVHSEAPSSFTFLKNIAIEKTRTIAIKHRFVSNEIIDTYFFSSVSQEINNLEIEVDRITGLRKVPIPMLSSLLKKVKSLIGPNPISTIEI